MRFYQLRSAWLGAGGQPVSRELAQKRADTCLLCPLRDKRPWWELFTEPFVQEMRHQIAFKNDLELKVDGEAELHTCGACDCILSLKVWCPIKHVVDTTPLDRLDTHCWIRQETK